MNHIHQGKPLSTLKPLAEAVIACALGIYTSSTALATSLEALAGAIGGIGNASIPQGCTTYGPPTPLGSFFGSGISIPIGGITSCGYSGGVNDVTAASGPLLTSKTLPPVLLGNLGFAGTFTGSADATADYKSLGASAHGTITSGGRGGPTALEETTGAAFFSDTLKASSPSIPDNSPGFIRYQFQFGGSLSTPGVVVPFHPGIAQARLDLQHDGGSIYRIAAVDSTRGQLGTLSSSDQVASSFVPGVGSISGSGIFSTTSHGLFQDFDLEITWNKPFDLKAGLMAWIDGTADADFATTAKLIGVELFDSHHNRVTDFTITSASGTSYAPIPEPAVFWMMIAGLMVMVARLSSVKRQVLVVGSS